MPLFFKYKYVYICLGWVGHICLPQPSVSLIMTGMAETAGWGITSMDTLDTANILQMLKIPLVPLDECAVFYKQLITLTEEQLCAGGKIDHDACGGDSGGPLMKVSQLSFVPLFYLGWVPIASKVFTVIIIIID